MSIDDMCEAVLQEMKVLSTPYSNISESPNIIRADISDSKDTSIMATPPLPRSTITIRPKKNKHPKTILFDRFKEFFHKELFDQFQYERPRMRAVISGGYGIKQLLENKYEVYNKVRTSDIDITFSTYKSTLALDNLYRHLSAKIQAFINTTTNPEDFKIKVINFGHAYVPLMDFHRDYVFMITYKDQDFIDVAITNQRISSRMLDRFASFKSGWPVKNTDYYLKEMLSLIYMETVPGVNDYCYAKRNPVTGEYSCKGVKDIYRSKVLCTVAKRKKYEGYCKIIKDITLQKLKNMPENKRDTYFSEVKKIISP